MFFTNVSSEVTLLEERVATVLTRERSLFDVHTTDMSLDFVLGGKAFATDSTDGVPRLLMHREHMGDEVVPQRKCTTTV